jgi:hypothetical protein
MSEGYVAPASYQQRQMWALDRLVSNPAAYGESWTARVRDALDLDVLERALAAIVDRHDTLRTTFELDGELLQRVGAVGTFTLARHDVSGLPPAEREAEAHRLAERFVSAPPDLVAGPILRAHTIALTPDEHWLVVASHHIVFDRWSASIFARELATAYEAFSAGAAPAWDELPVQYADYAEWQRERLDGGLIDAQLSYGAMHSQASRRSTSRSTVCARCRRRTAEARSRSRSTRRRPRSSRRSRGVTRRRCSWCCSPPSRRSCIAGADRPTSRSPSRSRDVRVPSSKG